MRRRSRASSKLANARSRKAKASKAVRPRSSSPAGQESEVVRLTRELDDAREQQTATAEVLKIISTSPTELRPVLEAVVRSGARFCEADDVTIFELDGQDLRMAAHWGLVTHLETLEIGVRFPCTRGSVAGRTVIDRKPVHVFDVQAEVEEFPEGSAFARRLGHRTTAGVPLLREGVAIGTIQLRRAEVNPFTNKQLALLETFAAQAVIAIENARLLNELRQRTADLTEALGQQTATSEVLKVISSSPGDLQPGFETMLANATRLCEAKFGTLWLCEGDALRAVALHGAPPAFAEERQRQPLILPRPETGLGRAVKTKLTVHSADLLAEQHVAPVLAKLAGARTYLAVPMLKDNEVIGAIGIYRQEVRTFTNKQVALVENFAAQAVIAIENTRLFEAEQQRTHELSESLEQQTATSEVLRVIARSPTDAQPAFEAMVARAARLCEADFSAVARFENGLLHLVAMNNLSPAEREAFDRLFPRPPERNFVMGRAFIDGVSVQFEDVLADLTYDPRTREVLQRLLGYRTFMAVPIIRNGKPIGAIGCGRRKVMPFTARQIALVQTFADQALIAVENTRLFEAEQQRTRELSESLEQQTATSEVLRVISNSFSDIQPVFESIVQSGVKLFSGAVVSIALVDNDMVRAAAVAHSDLAHAEAWRGVFPFPLTR